MAIGVVNSIADPFGRPVTILLETVEDSVKYSGGELNLLEQNIVESIIVVYSRIVFIVTLIMQMCNIKMCFSSVILPKLASPECRTTN